MKKKPAMGRPAEGRVRMNIHVTPETAAKINAAVVKTDPKMNTQGKVVDALFLKSRVK